MKFVKYLSELSIFKSKFEKFVFEQNIGIRKIACQILENSEFGKKPVVKILEIVVD